MNNTHYMNRITTGYTINPYFSDDPQFYFISLKAITVINLFVSGIVLYCMIFKSPKILSKTFIGLLSYHVVLGIMLLIHLSFLSTPIFYLPYIAIKCVGVYSTLGIPAAVEIGIFVVLVLNVACTTVPLFYYRMDALLPPSHILKSKFLRYLVYILTYGLFTVIPIPLCCLIVAYDNQEALKQRLFQSIGVYYEDFMSDRVIVTQVDGSNPFTYPILFSFAPFICVLDVVIIVTSSYTILKLTSNVGNAGIIGSAKYKAQQRQLFFSLVAMAAVLIPALGGVAPIFVYLLCTNSLRVDLVNIAAVICAAVVPTCFFIYENANKSHSGRNSIYCRQAANNLDSLDIPWPRTGGISKK